MAADTICRIASTTKPIVAACAMTLVGDCTLRLDDPVDEFLPELADMTVLADPDGPLEDIVPANRPVTLRDLLTFTLGTGIAPAEPGTVPIADALNALEGEGSEQRASSCASSLPPDEWIRRLGALPLVCQPGERWIYNTAVRTRRTHLGPSVGSYGWHGGYGIIWYNDPAEDMTAILMIQRSAGVPTLPIFLDFFTAAYQAIED